MTKERLNEIIKLKREVEQLREKLRELNYGDNETIVTDRVRGSMAQFPYLPRSFTLVGCEQMSEECIRKRDAIGKKISDKYHELYGRIDEAIDFIQSIDDSDVRQILTYKYIDGLIWEQIGQCMNYGTSSVRLKHDKFMKSIND